MMKSSTLLFLALVTVPLSAHADSVVALTANSGRLISAARRDIRFLSTNMANCTAYASTIQGRLLDPVSRDLTEALDSLNATYGKFHVKSGPVCARPSNQELSRGTAVVNKILASLNAKLALATQPQSALMGMTGDTAMTRALSTDGSYPKCIAENPFDQKSTRELKRYFDLKQKLIMLRKDMTSLKAETDSLQRGGGQEVCVSSEK